MITPFPVPIQSLWLAISKAVILAYENPSFPVPDNKKFIV